MVREVPWAQSPHRRTKRRCIVHHDPIANSSRESCGVTFELFIQLRHPLEVLLKKLFLLLGLRLRNQGGTGALGTATLSGGCPFQSEGATNYRLFLHRNGSYELANQTHELVFGSSLAITQGWHSFNQVTIVVQKHTFFVYINGQLIVQVEDSSSSYGAIGVIAVDETKATRITFENIHIF